MQLRLSGVNYARCKPLHRRGSRGNDRPRGRAIALSVVIAAGALLLIMPPVIGVTGTLESADGADCGLWRRVGIHSRTITALSLTPGGDALGLSAVSGRLAAGAGGLVWRAGLAGTAAGRGVRWGRERLSPGALRRVGRRCRGCGSAAPRC